MGECRSLWLWLRRNWKSRSWDLDRIREGTKHELARDRNLAEGSVFICRGSNGRNVSLQYRLHNSQSVHLQGLWERAQASKEGCRSLEVHGGIQSHANSSAVITERNRELRSSFSPLRQIRLHSPNPSLQQVVQDIPDSPLNRSICDQILCQDSEILLHQKRPSGDRSRCLLDSLAGGDSLCLPSRSPLTQNDLESRRGGCSPLDCPSAHQGLILVPQDQETSCEANLDPTRSADLPSQRFGPSISVEDLVNPWEHPSMNSLSSNAWRFNKAIGQNTKTRRTKIIASFRQCFENKRLRHFTGAHIIDYLANLPKTKMSQFCTIRTAINTTIHQNVGINFSDDLLFQKLSKGIMRKHPLDPKYDEIWDLNILTKHIREALPCPGKESKIDLCTKANVLIRASIAGRNGDVAHIHRKSITWGEDSVKFRLYRWKTQGASSTRYSNFFVICKIEDPKIWAYLKSVDCDSIWLDYQGKHPVKPATLANCGKRPALMNYLALEQSDMQQSPSGGTEASRWTESSIEPNISRRAWSKNFMIARPQNSTSSADILDGWSSDDEDDS